MVSKPTTRVMLDGCDDGRDEGKDVEVEAADPLATGAPLGDLVRAALGVGLDLDCCLVFLATRNLFLDTLLTPLVIGVPG